MTDAKGLLCEPMAEDTHIQLPAAILADLEGGCG